jgi:hypothetical protein
VRPHRIVCFVSFCLSFTLTTHAQQAARGFPVLQGNPAAITEDAKATREDQDQVSSDLAKKANMARMESLKNDTEKLLKLAEQLKDSVDKSGANVLSLDVVKKAEQIEKLAHSVKEKMKGEN